MSQINADFFFFLYPSHQRKSALNSICEISGKLHSPSEGSIVSHGLSKLFPIFAFKSHQSITNHEADPLTHCSGQPSSEGLQWFS
jgi:hypothetical protein